MVDLNALIQSCPDFEKSEDLAEWFARVRNWSRKHGYDDIFQCASVGLQHIGYRMSDGSNRARVLGMLKAVCGEETIVSDKIEIFIVHGHDESLKVSVERFLERLHLAPIVLHEQADCGNTIIEKLERDTANVCFGVVLYTADDKCESGHMRARQNVVFEHGMLIGLLGRKNVCVICEHGVELPGDISGVIYSDKSDWKHKLLKELQAAGIPVDANDVL